VHERTGGLWRWFRGFGASGCHLLVDLSGDNTHRHSEYTSTIDTGDFDRYIDTAGFSRTIDINPNAGRYQ
jgi:hypothetical protein